MSHKAAVVLKALAMGLPFKNSTMDESIFLADGCLCIKGEKASAEDIKNGSEGEDCYLRVDITFAGFLKMCECLTNDELASIAANIVLNSEKRNAKRTEDEANPS